jgi:hypothetical protein
MDEVIEQYDDFAEPRGLSWRPFNEYGFASPWAPCLWKASIRTNYLISAAIALVIDLIFAVASEPCQHWCLIPLALCGTLIGADFVAWARGEINVLDPKTVVAAMLYLNCFLAPLLHLTYNIYGKGAYTSDWPAYFGYMAWFNAAGIILLKLGHNIFFKIVRPVKSFWQIAPDRFIGIFIVVLVISLFASGIIRFFFGGLVRGSLFTAMEASYLSTLVMLGDPAPLLMTMAIIFWILWKNPDKQQSLTTVVCILIFISVFQFLWVGLRGSRSGILWTVLIVSLIIHYRLRPLSIKFLIVCLCIMFVFAYLYDFYKKLGPKGWEAVWSSQAREELSRERGGVGPLETLLGDFAEADVQAVLLYNLGVLKDSFKPVHGQTYIMSALIFIPRVVWKNKPKSPKLRAATELQGASGYQQSSRVYGLPGEGMLNFGYYGILPPFFVFGALFGWFRKKLSTMEPTDSRFFVIPVLFMTFVLATGDTDNWTFGLLRIGTLPFITVFFGSIRSKFAVD